MRKIVKQALGFMLLGITIPILAGLGISYIDTSQTFMDGFLFALVIEFIMLGIAVIATIVVLLIEDV